MSGSTETITVSLTMADWQVVYAGLGELPLKVSAMVANKLQHQLAASQMPAHHAQRPNGELLASNQEVNP